MGQMRCLGDFIEQQWRVEAQFGPDLVADMVTGESTPTGGHQRHMAQASQVRRDGAQRESDGPQGRRGMVFMQEILIDVKAVDEQVGAVVRCIETQPVLVRVLNQLGVDDGEVKTGRCLVGTESALDLLMDTAAIEHQRYRRGVPPRMAGDYAFISHMVETLAPAGRMAAVVTLGVLFRTGAERQIREQLVRENLIDAVIALPTKMFAHTAIPVAILVLRKRKADDGVMFIDASQTYQHGKTQNVLRESDLSMIEDIYRQRQDVEPYARLVDPAEIAANDFNLSVARYVAAAADEELVDLDALRAERVQLKSELARLEAKLSALLEEAGHA